MDDGTYLILGGETLRSVSTNQAGKSRSGHSVSTSSLNLMSMSNPHRCLLVTLRSTSEVAILGQWS